MTVHVSLVGRPDEWHWRRELTDLGDGWAAEWWYRVGDDGRIRGGRWPYDLPIRGRVFRDVRQLGRKSGLPRSVPLSSR